MSGLKGFAVESVWRRGHHSIRSVLGVVLAVAMVAGSFVAIDSSGYGLLSGMTEVDFLVMQNNQGGHTFQEIDDSQLSRIATDIESIKQVEVASPLVFLSGVSYLTEGGLDYQDSIHAGAILFLPSERKKTDEIRKAYSIEGDVPNPGSLAIPSRLALDLGLQIGSKLVCSFEQRNYTIIDGNQTYESSYVNLTLSISQIWKQNREWHEQGDDAPAYNDRDTVVIANFWNPVILNFADMQSISQSFLLLGEPVFPGIDYLVWTDRGSVLNAGDMSKTIDRLMYIENRIYNVFEQRGLDVFVASPLKDMISSTDLDFGRMKILFVGLSLPIIVMGTYLSYVSIELGSAERRREIATLKSRGASNSQVLSVLAVESLVLGAIGGCIGLVAGVGLSRALLGTTASFLGGSVSGSARDVLDVSWWTILLSVTFGILFMFLSTYPHARRIVEASPAETLHQYSPVSAGLEYNPRWDIIVLAIVAIGSLAAVLQKSELGGEAPIVTQLVVFALYSLSMAITPLVPFLLTFSLIRIITRSSRGLYAKVALIFRPWTGALHDVVTANIMRNPRRASGLCAIISLAISLSLLASLTMESTIAHEYDVLRYEIGADIRLESASPFALPGDTNASKDRLNSLGAMQDVEAFSIFSSALVFTTGGSTQATIFDPAAYQQVVGSRVFSSVGLSHADIQQLERNGTAIATEWFSGTAQVERGDTVFVTMSIYNRSTDSTEQCRFPLTIVLITEGLPGFSEQSLFLGEGTLRFLKNRTIDAIVGAFIAVRDGGDEPGVTKHAEDLFLSLGFSLPEVRVLSIELDRVKNEPYFGALARFLYIEIVLIMLTMSIGVWMLMYMTVIDREYELACIAARGSSRSQIRSMMRGESLTLILLGIVVGAPVGFLTAASLCSILGRLASTPVQYALSFPPITAALLLGYIGLLVLASESSSVRAGRMRIAEQLRLRGG